MSLKSTKEQEDIRIAKDILSSHKKLTLVSCANGKLWAGAVYFAEQDGYIYICLEKGNNYNNVISDPHVFFVIDHGVPDQFMQGEGTVELLGPIQHRPERHIIFRKVFELVPIVKTLPGAEIVRIKPTRLYISDYTGELKPRHELNVTEKVLREFKTELKAPELMWKNYLKATRPFAFTAIIIPLIVGSFMAKTINVLYFFMSLMSLLLLHAGSNVLSDYFDYKKGADNWNTLGSSRVLVDGLMEPGRHLTWGVVLFALGSIIGFGFIYLLGAKILLIALLGAGFGFFYAAPPINLKYRALGDIAVFMAFGPLTTMGAYFLQTRMLSFQAALIGIPIGLLTTGILHANNFRDIKDDLKSGYKTIAILLGFKRSKFYYIFLISATYALTVFYIVIGWLPVWSILSLLTVFHAAKNIKIASVKPPVAFTFLDLLTAQLHMSFGLLIILGQIISRTI